MIPIDLTCPTGAIFSPDRIFRYVLWRIWSQSRPLLMCTGLNPSKASETVTDPTVTQVCVRADRAGFGGLLMTNMYGFVSTDPKRLLEDSDHVGPENDAYLREMIRLAGRHLCAWGAFPAAAKREAVVLAMFKDPYCLGVTQGGHPRHPLRISYDTPMVPYRPAQLEALPCRK